MSYNDALARIGEIRVNLGIETAPAKDTTVQPTGTGFATEMSALQGKMQVANPGGVTGDDIVAEAKKYLGVPYVLGGTTMDGMDCSGLVQTVYGNLGIDVPRLVRDQQNIGVEVPSLAEAKPGDLIVGPNADHIVIYAGDGKVIHAPYEGRTVSYQDNFYSEDEIVTIRRVIPEPQVTTARMGAGSSSQQAQLAALQQLLSGMNTQNSTQNLIDLIGASQLTVFGRTS
ncbi:C40 family peptidase [Agromyces sp. NPDC057679]|uniref:C40 family peptidase n=1 Tax=Agromyces sp. NPDC057679 TaxID=3346207 RepID=UPI00366C706E